MELYHHGIKGQKWGVRRFQNPDGTLTSTGRDRYGYGHGGSSVSMTSEQKNSLGNKQLATAVGIAVGKKAVANILGNTGHYTLAMAADVVGSGAAIVAGILGSSNKISAHKMNKSAQQLGGSGLQQQKFPNRQEAREYKKAYKEYSKAYQKNYIDAHNAAARRSNEYIPALNKKWEKKFKGYDDWSKSPLYDQYVEEEAQKFDKLVTEELEKRIGKPPEILTRY